MEAASQRPAGAGRVVAAAVLLFLVAILMGRLLWDDSGLWKFFLLALPILLALLSLALGFLRAVMLLAFFVASVLTVRWIVSTPGIGWPVIVLGLVLLFASFLAARVARSMWPRKSQPSGEETVGTEKNGEEKEEGNFG
jgi:membrane protein implicated in regulation of membrane protease activity